MQHVIYVMHFSPLGQYIKHMALGTHTLLDIYDVPGKYATVMISRATQQETMLVTENKWIP